jgi:hypothetical protein
MPKAGSSTTAYIMKMWAKENGKTIGGPSDHSVNPEYYDDTFDIVSSFSTPMLYQRGIAKHCKWFTVFRHPASRVVSAYMYCKYKNPHDILCGTEGLNTHSKTVPFEEFAKFWSNFALRQLVLAVIPIEDILASPSVLGMAHGLTAFHKVQVYAEDQLNSTYSVFHDIGMVKYMQPAMDVLKTYSAIGTVEDFDGTMRLFDATLGMEGMHWEKMNTERVNTIAISHEEEYNELTRLAYTDPSIREYMMLDIILYDYAVSLHDQQIKENGL